MKRIFFGLIIFSFIVVSSAFAQTQKQYDKVKERIQKELKVDESKADSTASILRQFFTKMRNIRENEGMTDANKQLAIKKEKRKEVARLKTILTADQLKKLRQMVQQYKDMRQQKNEPDPSDTTLSKYYF